MDWVKLHRRIAFWSSIGELIELLYTLLVILSNALP